MSNKAKRAKAVKARKHQQTLVNNRIRGIAKNFNLTDAEAVFYRRALVSKETPVQFVESITSDLEALLDTFNLVADVASEEELMAQLAIAYPTTAESIKNGNEYIVNTRKQLADLKAKYLAEFEGLDNTGNSFLFASTAMEEFSALNEELIANAASMMTTIQQITEVYADIESKFPGEENVHN